MNLEIGIDSYFDSYGPSRIPQRGHSLEKLGTPQDSDGVLLSSVDLVELHWGSDFWMFSV